jgi:hypothetical protein
MKCLKCGEQNPNSAKYCFNCHTLMTWTPDSEFDERELIVKVSRIAITAILLALCGLFFVLPSLFVPVQGTSNLTSTSRGFFFLAGLIISGIALILGFISLIQVEISGGRTTGTKFAIAAILLPIVTTLLPVWHAAARRPRSVAFRMVCGTNLSGLGKAMLIYANDYNDKLPRAAGKGGTWGTSVSWNAPTRQGAYGMNSDGTGGAATVSGSLYLLVKYAEVTPRSFICTDDKNVFEFAAPGWDLTRLWDFGPQPWNHLSYSYHMPYGANALTTSSNPGMAVAADRNPWIPSPGWSVKDFNAFNPDGSRQAIMSGNSFPHKDEGQNVLYLDSHVNFESVPSCGINGDNIYTSWNGKDIRKGKKPELGSQPANKNDSLLVNDPNVDKP